MIIHTDIVADLFFHKKHLKPTNICSLPTKWIISLGFNISSLLWLALAWLKPFVIYTYTYTYTHIYIHIYIYIHIKPFVIPWEIRFGSMNGYEVLRFGYMRALALEGGSRAWVTYQIGIFFIFISFLFRRSTTCVIQYSQMIDNENITLCFLKQIQYNKV